MNLSSLHNLKNERLEIAKRLTPINTLSNAKYGELAKLRADILAADGSLHAAIQHAAHVEGLSMIGDATPEEVATAKKARRAAETAHAATQAASVGVGALAAEIDGLGEAGRELGLRFGEICVEEVAAQERYLRGLADDAAREYADAARVLASKLSAVLAYHQALARADLNPDLLTAGVWHFGIPALNSPSARTPSGCLADIDSARREQPEQLAIIRARLAADGVQIDSI